MNEEALIFDCDGTITDSMPAHFVAWRSSLGRYGLELSEDRFYRMGGMPTDKIVALLSSEQNISVDPAAVAIEKEEAFLQSLHLLELIPAVAEVVRQNHGRCKMAVASGGMRRVIELQLQQVGLLDCFDAIVCAEDTQRHKPFPDVFLEAARRMGAEPTRCTVYEDSDLGIEAARAAGMQWVDIRQFHTPKRVHG